MKRTNRPGFIFIKILVPLNIQAEAAQIALFVLVKIPVL